jgi:hypothetical protein
MGGGVAGLAGVVVVAVGGVVLDDHHVQNAHELEQVKGVAA